MVRPLDNGMLAITPHTPLESPASFLYFFIFFRSVAVLSCNATLVKSTIHSYEFGQTSSCSMQNRPAYAWNELAFSVLVKVSNWVSASCQPHSITSGHSNSLISKCTFQNSFHNFLKLKVPNQSIQKYKTFIHNYMNFCCFSLCKHVGGGVGGGLFLFVVVVVTADRFVFPSSITHTAIFIWIWDG